MSFNNLGGLQEMVLLTIMVLEDNDSYGAKIQREIFDRTNKRISRGALHTALIRLEEKGFIISKMSEATNIRGGRRKRIFTITQNGVKVLKGVGQIRAGFYKEISILDFGQYKQ